MAFSSVLWFVCLFFSIACNSVVPWTSGDGLCSLFSVAGVTASGAFLGCVQSSSVVKSIYLFCVGLASRHLRGFPGAAGD